VHGKSAGNGGLALAFCRFSTEPQNTEELLEGQYQQKSDLRSVGNSNSNKGEAMAASPAYRTILNPCPDLPHCLK
jgi:hypothetical protein